MESEERMRKEVIERRKEEADENRRNVIIQKLVASRERRKNKESEERVQIEKYRWISEGNSTQEIDEIKSKNEFITLETDEEIVTEGDSDSQLSIHNHLSNSQTEEELERLWEESKIIDSEISKLEVKAEKEQEVTKSIFPEMAKETEKLKNNRQQSSHFYNNQENQQLVNNDKIYCSKGTKSVAIKKKVKLFNVKLILSDVC